MGLLIRGEVGGWQGLYGTDVATGALVRLHDLPGTGGGTSSHWPDDVAVSPDGHLLSDGVLVVDLRAATVRAIAGAVPLKAGSAGAMSGTVAVRNDGMVLAVSTSGQLWRYPVTGRPAPAAVAGIGDVMSIRLQTDGRVLVTGANSVTGPSSHDPTVNLVDPAGDRPSVLPVPNLSRNEAAAESNGTVIRPTGAGGLEMRNIQGTQRSRIMGRFGQVHALAFGPFGSGGHATGVVLGTADRGAMAVRQVPLDLAASWSEPVTTRVTELTRIPVSGDRALAGTTRITPAAEVVAAPVILIDLPTEPWWAPLAGPGRTTGALILIALGVLFVVSGIRLPRLVRT